MKNVIGISLLWLSFTVLHAQPQIQIEEQKFDFGELSAGQIVERNVILKNVGTETLLIGKVEASCGCTGTLVSSEKLKPGESGSLKVTFNSRNFNGKAHKSVTVNSNDPATPRAKIEFTASVTEEVMVSEAQFVFKDATVGERKTAVVTLRNNGKEPIELKNFETTLEGLTLKYPTAVAVGQTVELTAEFLPKEPKRVLSSNVTLETTSKSKPELLFRVFGNVKEWKFE